MNLHLLLAALWVRSELLGNLLAWSLQVGLLVVAAAVLARLIRIDAPPVRYAWWRGVLIACLFLPLLQRWTSASGSVLIATVDELPLGTDAWLASGTALHRTSVFADLLSLPWVPVITFVLVAGAVLRLSWLAAGLIRLHRLRFAGEPAGGCDEHQELALLTQAGAEIRYVDLVGQPITFGVRHPIVLLPVSLRTLPEPVRRAVLAHELWHVRRRDWAWVVAEELTRAVFWFHPGIWWLVSRVQAAREEVVDELTILVTNSRRSYLEALLAFADEPPLFAAAPFARRRHLFHRMLLLSTEAVMSSKRITVSCAVMALALVAAAWYGATVFPLRAVVVNAAASPGSMTGVQTGQPAGAQAQPRDRRPGEAGPPTARELQLQQAISANTAGERQYVELARLQETRGAIREAEATLVALRAAVPGRTALAALAGFYARTNQYDRAISTVEEAVALDPGNPASHTMLATFYQARLQNDRSLNGPDALALAAAGIAAVDRALALDPEYFEALVYRSVLLRHQARFEPDTARQQQLIAEADTLRQRAMELRNARSASDASGAALAPVQAGSVDSSGALRVGGNIATPKKIKDVRPVYPPDAQAARIQGLVIIQARIDEAGKVADASVLRSTPMLDEAALEAVYQWEFTPTLLNGVAVPVIMTVTVNFTLQ